METLAQQVADLQDEAEGREDAHSERVAALQATIERLSGEAQAQSESRAAELEAKCAALEEQVSGMLQTPRKSVCSRSVQQAQLKLQSGQPQCWQACRADRKQCAERCVPAMIWWMAMPAGG